MGVYEYIGGTSLEYIFLLFMRVSGLIFSSPIFGRQNVPAMAKVSFCLAFTYFFYVTIPQAAPIPGGTVLTFALYCALELLFGLVMGYVLTLFFSITYTAGQIIDMQIGFGMVNVFDVQSNTSVPVTGNLLNVMLMLCFFATNSHQRLIELMRDAIVNIPIGNVVFNAELGTVIAQLFTTSFLLAVRMALPIVAAGLLAEAVLGMILRTVPQMNVFVVGLPLKVLLGLGMLLIIMPVYVAFTGELFETMFSGIRRGFAALG